MLVMAIVDVDPGQVRAAVAEGADIVDIVGVGGRPGEEIAAFIQVVRNAYPDLVIGLSPGRLELVREACAAGADLILAGLAEAGGLAGLAEVRGLAGLAEVEGLADLAQVRGLAGLAAVAAEFGAGMVCPDALVAHVVGAGVDPGRIIVEGAGSSGESVSPGLADLVASGWPVLVDAAAGDGRAGALARAAVCAWLGVRVFRARDVGQTRRVLRMVSAIRGDIPPARAVRGLA